MSLTHEQAIARLRREGFPVDDNPDLLDVIGSTSPNLPAESARLQSRYWDLRNPRCDG